MKITQPDGTTYELNWDETRELMAFLGATLIGETPEGIEVKQMIANAFAERYLKSIAHNATMSAVASGAANTAKTVVQEELRTYFSQRTQAVKSEIVEEFRAVIRDYMKAQWRVIFETQWERMAIDNREKLLANLDSNFNASFTREVEKAINVEVTRRMQIVLDAVAHATKEWKAQVISAPTIADAKDP